MRVLEEAGLSNIIGRRSCGYHREKFLRASEGEGPAGTRRSWSYKHHWEEVLRVSEEEGTVGIIGRRSCGYQREKALEMPGERALQLRKSGEVKRGGGGLRVKKGRGPSDQREYVQANDREGPTDDRGERVPQSRRILQLKKFGRFSI